MRARCWMRRRCCHPADLKLLEWAADYYHHPVGEVFATALPRLLRTVRKRRRKADETPPAVPGNHPSHAA